MPEEDCFEDLRESAIPELLLGVFGVSGLLCGVCGREEDRWSEPPGLPPIPGQLEPGSGASRAARAAEAALKPAGPLVRSRGVNEKWLPSVTKHSAREENDVVVCALAVNTVAHRLNWIMLSCSKSPRKEHI